MRTNTDSKAAEPALLPEYVRMYYAHQYARMSHLQSAKITVTNVVMTLSVVGLTFGFRGDSAPTFVNGVALPLGIVAANLFAILFAWGTHLFERTHQQRAHRVLKMYGRPLYEINRELPWPARWRLGSLTRTLTALHALLSVVGLLPFFAYVGQFK